MTPIVAVHEIHYADPDTGKQVIAKPGTLFLFADAASLGDAVREPTEGELAIYERATAPAAPEKPVKVADAKPAGASKVADTAKTTAGADLVG